MPNTAETHTTASAYERGVYDASRDRAPLFRSTSARGIVSTSEDPLSDEWSQIARQAYLDGYDESQE